METTCGMMRLGRTTALPKSRNYVRGMNKIHVPLVLTALRLCVCVSVSNLST